MMNYEKNEGRTSKIKTKVMKKWIRKERKDERKKEKDNIEGEERQEGIIKRKGRRRIHFRKGTEENKHVRGIKMAEENSLKEERKRSA